MSLEESKKIKELEREFVSVLLNSKLPPEILKEIVKKSQEMALLVKSKNEHMRDILHIQKALLLNEKLLSLSDEALNAVFLGENVDKQRLYTQGIIEGLEMALDEEECKSSNRAIEALIKERAHLSVDEVFKLEEKKYGRKGKYGECDNVVPITINIKLPEDE